ncbi:unnamed protein product [Amoebophrya sp. A25]|nr:unnamed protein product [Amoebophrya sp. A25]|eukprot:GSA25T00007296001.1
MTLSSSLHHDHFYDHLLCLRTSGRKGHDGDPGRQITSFFAMPPMQAFGPIPTVPSGTGLSDATTMLKASSSLAGVPPGTIPTNLDASTSATTMLQNVKPADVGKKLLSQKDGAASLMRDLVEKKAEGESFTDQLKDRLKSGLGLDSDDAGGDGASDENPPSVRSNLAHWLQLKSCGYGGWIWEEGAHPEITFAKPQSFVHVRLVDDNPVNREKARLAPSTSSDPQTFDPLKDALNSLRAGADQAPKVYPDDLNKASMVDNNGKMPLPTPDDAELVYWDATYFLNGGIRITPRMQPVKERAPFFLDCRRRTRLRLEVEVDAQAEMDYLRGFFGRKGLAQIVYDTIRPPDPLHPEKGGVREPSPNATESMFSSFAAQAAKKAKAASASVAEQASSMARGALSNATGMDFRGERENLLDQAAAKKLGGVQHTFPLSLDFQHEHNRTSEKAEERVAACRRICRAHQCPPAHTEPRAVNEDRFSFARASCRDECVSPSFLELVGFEAERAGLNGNYLMVDSGRKTIDAPPSYFRVLPEENKDLGDKLSNIMSDAKSMGKKLVGSLATDFAEDLKETPAGQAAEHALKAAAAMKTSVLKPDAGGAGGYGSMFLGKLFGQSVEESDHANDPKDAVEKETGVGPNAKFNNDAGGSGEDNTEEPPTDDAAPRKYALGTLGRHLRHDSEAVMDEFRNAKKVAMILYDHDQDQRWGVYVAERTKDSEIVKKVATSASREDKLPSRVAQWLDPETSKPFHTDGGQGYTPKVLFDYCRPDGLVRPSAQVRWASKRVIFYESPKPKYPNDVSDVEETQFFNRMGGEQRSTGKLCKHTRTWSGDRIERKKLEHLLGKEGYKNRGLVGAETTELQSDVAANGFHLDKKKKLSDAMVFRLYEACRRHDRSVDIDMGLRDSLGGFLPNTSPAPTSADDDDHAGAAGVIPDAPDGQVGRGLPHDPLTPDVAPYRCLDPATEERIDALFSGREIEIDESSESIVKKLGLSGRWKKLMRVTEHGKYRSEYIQEGGRLHLFEVLPRAELVHTPGAKHDLTRWHIAPLAHPVPAFDASGSDHKMMFPSPPLTLELPEMGADVSNPAVGMLNDVAATGANKSSDGAGGLGAKFLPRSSDPELHVGESILGGKHNDPVAYEAANAGSHADEAELGPEAVLERVRIDFGKHLELKTSEDVWAEDDRVGKLRRLESNGRSVEETEELKLLLAKRFREGQWVLKNRDNVAILAEEYGGHARHPGEVERWFLFNPYRKVLTNERAAVKFKPNLQRITSSGTAPPDSYLHKDDDAEGKPESLGGSGEHAILPGGSESTIDTGKTFFEMDRFYNSPDDLVGFSTDRKTLSPQQLERFDSRVNTIDPGRIEDSVTHLQPIYRPGEPFWHQTRTPCQTSSEFTNGAKCIGGVRAALRLMREQVAKCIDGDPPCVKTFTDVASVRDQGVEDCEEFTGEHEAIQTAEEELWNGPAGGTVGKKRKLAECQVLHHDIRTCRRTQGCKVGRDKSTAVYNAKGRLVKEGEFHCTIDDRLFGPEYPVSEDSNDMASGAAFMPVAHAGFDFLFPSTSSGSAGSASAFSGLSGGASHADVALVCLLKERRRRGSRRKKRKHSGLSGGVFSDFQLGRSA